MKISKQRLEELILEEMQGLQQEGFFDTIKGKLGLGTKEPAKPAEPPMMVEFNSWSSKFSEWLNKSKPLLKNSHGKDTLGKEYNLLRKLEGLEEEIKLFPKIIAAAVSLQQQSSQPTPTPAPVKEARHISMVQKDMQVINAPYYEKFNASYQPWLKEADAWTKKYFKILNQFSKEIVAALKKDPEIGNTIQDISETLGNIIREMITKITDELKQHYDPVLSPEDQKKMDALNREWSISYDEREAENTASLHRRMRQDAQNRYDAGAPERAAAAAAASEKNYQDRRAMLGDFAKSGGSYSGNRYPNQFKQREGKTLSKNDLRSLIKEQLKQYK